MGNKKIMILGASDLQLPAIKKAKEMNLYVIGIDYDKNAVGLEFCDKHYVISTNDYENVIKVAETEKIDGIMTAASDRPMLTVAKVAEKMSLPGISVETSKLVTNKYLMRKCFLNHNIPCPIFKKIISAEDLIEFVKCCDNGTVIKPTLNSGSRGIQFIEKSASRNQVKKAYEYSLAYSDNGEIIAEEFMVGKEISVESVTQDGKTSIIQMTDKLTSGKPNFVEIGHSQPSVQNESKKAEIEKLVIDTIEAVGLIDGASHIELMITSGGTKIVEIGARLGGDFITSHLVPLSTGVNMVEMAIKIAVGDKIEIPKIENKAASILFFSFPKGKVINIMGYEDLLKSTEVKQANLALVVGDKIGSMENSTSRLGYVIATGRDSEESFENCKKAYKKLSVEIE